MECFSRKKKHLHNLQASPGLCLASPHLSNLTGVRGQPRGLVSTNERPELSGGEQCRGRLVATSGPMQAVNFTIWDTQEDTDRKTQTGGKGQDVRQEEEELLPD